MARSIADIQADMIAAIQADAILSGVSSGSKTAIWRLWTFVVASAIWVLEKLFDAHVLEVTALVEAMKPHTLKWYVLKAKAFRFGQALDLDTDRYDDTGLTDAQITALTVVKEAAAIEQNGKLVLKVAGRNGSDEPVPLSIPQYNAFVTYINEVKDAGVAIQVITFQGDRIRITMDVFYNPLVLAPDGSRLDGLSIHPLKDALIAYFKAMPFNGVFVKSTLVDALQKVEGVIVPEVRFILAAKFDTVNWQSVDVFYQPYAGYFTLQDVDLVVNYTAA
jgi:hypothetical protein